MCVTDTCIFDVRFMLLSSHESFIASQSKKHSAKNTPFPTSLCGHFNLYTVLKTTCKLLIYSFIYQIYLQKRFRRGVLDTPLCDKVCQWLATGQWFSSGTPISSTNKTCHHDIAEILLKVALITIRLTKEDIIINWTWHSLPTLWCILMITF